MRGVHGVDRRPSRDSCLVPAFQVEGREVRTSRIPRIRALHASWRDQCGACTPGVVMTALWILENPGLRETHSIREIMAGNICRCTGYDGILEGIQAAMNGARSVTS